MKIEKITPQIAALYLGVKCEYPDNEGVKTFATLTGVRHDGIETTFKRKKNGVCGDILGWEQRSSRQKCFAGALVLHLRSLESITEEEALDIIKLYKGRDAKIGDNLHDLWEKQTCDIEDAIGTPAVWLYLLSKGFDLFGLIEAGLAKEIKTETVNS